MSAQTIPTPSLATKRTASTRFVVLFLTSVALLAFCSSCRIRRAADMTAEYTYLQGELGAALDAAKQRSNDSYQHRDLTDFALDENIIASIALAAGDYRTAEKALISAGQVMGSFPGRSQQWAALIGEEGHKVYLGDPYEQAMNSLYTSLVLLRNGDLDNARAALKRGILADSASREEEYQSDIVALYLLEALLSLKVGKVSIAESDIRTVRELSPDHPYASRTFLEQVNTIVLIDVGEGPHKVGSGKYRELAVFHPSYNPTPSIELILNGEPLPPPVLGVDLDFQARTRGGREMDGILRGKAVFKEGAGVAGALLLRGALRAKGKAQGPLALLGGTLLLASLATQPQADTRHWYLLPAESHLWLGKIPPGQHALQLNFKTSPGGSELADYRQVWHHLPFREGTFNVYYFRADSNKGFGSPNKDGWKWEPRTPRRGDLVSQELQTSGGKAGSSPQPGTDSERSNSADGEGAPSDGRSDEEKNSKEDSPGTAPGENEEEGIETAATRRTRSRTLTHELKTSSSFAGNPCSNILVKEAERNGS